MVTSHRDLFFIETCGMFLKRVRPFLKGSDPFEAFLITGVAGSYFAGNGSAVKSVCFSALKSPVIHSGARGVFRV